MLNGLTGFLLSIIILDNLNGQAQIPGKYTGLFGDAM